MGSDTSLGILKSMSKGMEVGNLRTFWGPQGLQV